MKQRFHFLAMIIVMVALLAGTTNTRAADGIVSSTATDAFELDNTPEQASPIVVNDEIQWHGISVPGDIDWVSFPVQRGNVYWVEVTTLTSFDVAFSQEGDGLARRAGNSLLVMPRQDGRFSVAVRESHGQGAPDWLYQLRVVSMPSKCLFNQ